ncbi:MAG: EAL domain-containing protein [Pseudomonadota bacterium]
MDERRKKSIGTRQYEVPRAKHPLDFPDKTIIVELAQATVRCDAVFLVGIEREQHCVVAQTAGSHLHETIIGDLIRTITHNASKPNPASVPADPHTFGVPLPFGGSDVVGALILSGLKEPNLSACQAAAIANLQQIIGSLLKTNEAQRAASESKAELRLTLETMDQAITVFDGDARLTFWNQRYIDLFGIDPKVAKKGASLRDIIASQTRSNGFEGFDTEDYETMLRKLREGLARGETVEGGVRLESGRIISSVHTGTPDGGWVATHSDVTERVLAQEKVKHASEHDSMTGLLNRSKFTAEYERLSAQPGRVVAMLIDIDRFKSVNDNHGHGAGDAVIMNVAERLKGCVRQDDVVARLGGDEFAVLLSLGPQAGSDEARRLAEAVLDRMREDMLFEGISIDFSVSIGAYEIESKHEGLDDALSRADFALYRAKQDGRAKAQFFDKALARELDRSKLFSSLVTRETYDDTLALQFQPIVCLKTGKDCSFEALIRWAGPESDYLTPIGIIEAAEQNGAISCIGDWVLNNALRAHRSWDSDARIAVNLSPRQLGNGTVFEQVKQALEHHNVSPKLLELEVTENAVLQDEASFQELHELKQLGVQINLDDFGTGYASLTMLQRFPFDKLKIDRSFINRSDDDPLSGAIVRSVVGLGHELGLETVAEGIETQCQLDAMNALGCALGQGYFLGRPMNGVDVVQRVSHKTTLAA